MSETQSANRRADLKSRLLEQLHDPVRLRLFVIGVVLTAGYFAAYNPLQARIEETTKKLNRDKKMLKLATSFERLQIEYHKFENRIPPHTDSKEWVQFMLDGIRLFPLKLARFDCREPRQVGPYQAIELKVELEGSFLDMDKFLRWVESNRRLLRVDEISISPSMGAESVNTLRLTVLGLSS